MAKEVIAQQFDLFTGEAVPVGKYAPPKAAPLQQLEMFSQRDIAQFGVRANPKLPLSEHTRLVLIREDPRTPEEIERDNRREELSLITPMFPDQASSVVPTNISINQMADVRVTANILTPLDMIIDPLTTEERDNSEDITVLSQPVQKPSKLEIYKQVVNVVAEQSETIDATSVYKLSQKILLSITLFDAKHTGLTDAEIAAAMTIGEFQGQAKTQKIQTREIKSSIAPLPSINLSEILWTYDGAKQRLEISRI